MGALMLAFAAVLVFLSSRALLAPGGELALEAATLGAALSIAAMALGVSLTRGRTPE